MKRNLIVALAAALVATGAFAEAPKREFRSSWVAGMNIDWPVNSSSKGTTATAINNAKKELTTYLDNFKNQNFTGICLHVRPRADAYYKSSYEPWSADLTGTRGKDPGWDPLAFAVEECHKRGLECYAWINPFRVNANGVTYTTDFDKQWDEDGWLIRSGKWTIFNPGLPAARKHCLDVIKEIYTNYAVDGMLFDDYFYPGDGMVDTSDADDYQLWKDSGTTMNIGDWRRNNVNTFVKELYDEIQKTRPDLRFGIGPAGVAGASASKYGLSKPNISSSDWMYSKIYCDPLAWLNDGSIDFVSPQIYWGTKHSTAPYGPLCKWWSDVADHFGRHLYVSSGSYRLADSSNEYGGNNTTGWEEFVTENNLNREYTLNDAPGMIYYNTKTINGPQISGLGDYLAKKSYTRPSLIPVANWKEHVSYTAPAGLKQSGASLTWTATTGATAKSIIRYTVYAIPSDITMEEAQAGNGDGIDGEYLLGVTYSPSYTLPTDKASGHWYAVCVYDGYGYESEPALSGYTTEPSQATELLTPADGATAQWSQTFSWKAVPTATYRFQLAREESFTNIVEDHTRLSVTSQAVEFDNLTAAKYYWRVITTQAGKLPATSEVRAILPPVKSAAPKPVTTLPANNAVLEDPEVTFRWTCESGSDVEGYRLEVIKAAGDFAKPLYTTEVTSGKEVKVAASMFGLGAFKWRVVAYGSHLTETASAVANFTIENLPITEVGYTVKTDGSTYAPINKLELKSDWMRAEKTGWANMKFEEKGKFNRGMVATEDAVYISGRSDNSSSATLYLDVYSAENGQLLRRLELSGQTPVEYGCNDLFKDSKGNVCTSNLALSPSSSTPRNIYIYNINLVTGELTEVAHIQPGSLGRIDHVAVYGDVTSGNFTVMAAVSSTAKIATWKVTNGTVGRVSSKTCRDFYPSTASNFGIAPRVIPVSETEIYVDGGGTYWTHYDISGSRPTIISSFKDNTKLSPSDPLDNGGKVFSLKNHKFMVYNRTSSGAGSCFQIAHMPATSTNTKFSGYEGMWVVPEKKLGTVESGTSSAPVDAVVLDDIKARIYVYSPGNGLAAYTLTDVDPSGVDDITAADSNDITIDGLTVVCSRDAAVISAYSLTGALVATAYDSDRVSLPAAGTYIVRIDGAAHKVTVK